MGILIKNDHFKDLLLRVPDRQNLSVFPYSHIHFVPMARRKNL
jgi:hypothetical protein